MEKENVCCPKFNPEVWDEKSIKWQDKKFIVGKIPTIFYMPIGFGKEMAKMQSLVEKSGAEITDYLCLSDHKSPWKMELLLAVDSDVNGAQNKAISGNFYSKVYEGPFQDTGKWMKDFEQHLKEKNISITKTYMWYTTCPKCAKKYGKNYVVIIAKVI